MPNLSNDFEVRKETLRALGGNPDGLANIYEVDLEILKLIGSSEQGIPDAPIDGVQYARQNGEWTPVDSGIDWNTIKQKLAEEGVESIKFIMGNEEIILTASEVKNLLNQTVLPDAPSDGKQYARQDGNWTPVEEGISDAPSDGKTYGRNNGTWTTVKEGISDAPSDDTQYARQNGAWVPVQTPTEGKYITITADESNTGETIIHPNIEGSLPNLNLQYRINNEKWNDFIVGTTADIKIGAGDVLQFKGDNKEGVSKNDSGYNTLNFAISGNPVALSGNIMSLIDGVGETTVIPCDYCFCQLFRNSAAIKTVSSDFLPVTTLTNSCYRDLFSGCQNLTQAPELPATTLADGCYNGMFYSCKSLTTAPELPAKVLVDGCYGYMFTYCNLLNYVKCLATEGTINGDGTVPSALDNWLNGVASTGTFEKLSGVSYEAGGNGLPEGWTVKEIYDYVEAPIDGNQYARQNGTWTVVEPGITDSPSDGKTYGRNNGAWAVVEKGLTDSPSDGKQYARQNGNWTPVKEGLTDSPSDGKQYARQDGAWAVVEKGIPDAPIDGVQYARQNGEWTPVESGVDWNTIKQKLAEDGVESIKFIMGAEQVILTATELKTLLNQTVLPDAPSDGKQYARQNGNWTPVEEGLHDAPLDGQQYARQNGEWTPVESGGSVIPKGKYMTITVDDEVEGETIISPTVNGSLPNLNLQYRINNGSWNDFIVGTTADIHAVAGDVVQWKGINESGISNSTSNYLNFAISGNPVHLSGNVMSLIDGVGDTKDIPNKFCFLSLFKGSNVKTVSSDFLPVITLSDYCYCSMFQMCSNLVKAPELPATVLKIRCYYNMFWGCSNLVQAPKLPATVLAVGCYNQMFFGCSNLVQAPLLPATELVGNCYDSMFYECKNLKYVKSLAVEGLDSSTIGTWLYNVASSGTFEKPAGVVYKTDSSGIPEGWTVKEFDMYIEAPMDGKTYGRNNGNWTPVEEGITEAPLDGLQYARQNAAWVEVSKVKTTNNKMMQFWNGTQQEYDAISTKDANTLYIISQN